MTRAQVIAAYRHAAKLARAQGVTVTLDPGWTTRGRPGLTPRAIVEHDTSDAARLTRGRMLDILRNGHGTISGNAICNDAIMRDGEVVVIATGLAWHAGRSSWGGLSGLNGWALGTEYQRYVGDGLTDRQLEVGRIWTRARCVAFGIPVRRVCEHHECALPRGRKIDRSRRPGFRVDGAAWRRQLTTAPPAPTGDLTIGAFMATLSPDEQKFLKRAAAQAVADDVDGQSFLRQWAAFHRGPRVRLEELLRHVDDVGSSVQGLVRGSIGFIRKARTELGWKLPTD